MKKVSSAAIAAAFLVGFGGLSVATPAFAKKEEAPKGPVLSAAVRTPALAAQTACSWRASRSRRCRLRNRATRGSPSHSTI
jgi:hypothetical protein